MMHDTYTAVLSGDAGHHTVIKAPLLLRLWLFISHMVLYD